MRIWDIPIENLCRKHLLAEHRELHAIWIIIAHGKKGYSRHPEVLRWRGKLEALWLRHESQKREMLRRGYAHRSPLALRPVARMHSGKVQVTLIESIEVQRRKLRDKACECVCW
ncbi:MAG: pyrimidine dimer DNA glycosylase [Euryarchaeota archaeon RBG_19FT_COMBO_56_21]|nr:MAG: pyrimidine dimer DNA glycosylase [Euryarchaeota archaeon RBG_19FT_COMBO_56_21]